MAGIGTGAGPPAVNVYHEKSMILPDVSRVVACLYEKDVKFETIKASYKDIFSLQALRSVPVPFYDGPVFLQDSRAICRYIAETYKHQGYPFLLGKDVLERASIEQWLRHEEHAFDPPSRALFCHLAFPLHGEDDEDITREKRKLEEVLEVYEQRLGETEFLAGNKFTLADLVHLPGTHHVITSERFAYLYDSRKNVQRWWNTISARHSWQQVLRDMKTVEEQHIKEELEQQKQQQWQTEPLPTFGGRDIRIDPRKQEGTRSQTVLVAPPSTGTISTSIPSPPQDHETTSDQKPSSPIQTKQGGFFTTTGKPPPPSRQTDSTTQKPPSSDNSTKSTFFTPAFTPTTTKTHQQTDAEKFSYKDAPSHTERPPPPSRQTDSTTHRPPSSEHSTRSSFFTPSSAPISAKTQQRTDSEKPSYKDASSPSKTSQTSPKEAPDKPHLSDFFNARGHKDEAGSLAKPSTQDSSKIPGASQTREAVAPDKPSPGSAKTTHKIDESDSSETESKPHVDKPVPLTYTKPDIRTPQTPYKKPPEQRVTDVSVGPEAGEKQKNALHTPYAQKRAEQVPMASADHGAAAHFPGQVASKDAKGETAKQSTYTGAPAVAKKATEADEDRTRSSPAKEVPSGAQNARKQAKAPPTGLKVSGQSTLPGESEEDTPDVISDDDRFSTKRLRAGFNPDVEDSQDPAKEEEAPAVPRKPSDVHDREKQTPMVPDNGKSSGSPTTGVRAPSAPTIAGERRTVLPPKGGMATGGAEKSPSIPQVPPGAPSTDKLAKTAGVDTRAPQQTPTDARNGSALVRGADPSTLVTSDAQSDKSSAMGEKAQEATPRKIPPSDSRGTSAPIQEAIHDSRVKQAPASGGQNANTAPHGGNLDANGRNEAVKPSPTDPRGMLPNTPGRLAPTPDTQRPTASGKMSAQSQPLPSISDTRNENTDITETSQTRTVAPNQQLGGRVPRDAGPSPMKPQEDKTRAQLAENKKKQDDDIAPITKTGKPIVEDFVENANDNNSRQAQATTKAASKIQIQSDQNKPQPSKDGGTGTNETENSPILATRKELLPSPPKKSMGQQQLQGNRSGTSLQGNVKKGSEAAPLGSGVEQQNKKDLPTEDDKNNGKTPGEVKTEEKNSSDTQQVKDNRSDSKPDSSSKPTKLEDNEGNLPESNRRGS